MSTQATSYLHTKVVNISPRYPSQEDADKALAHIKELLTENEQSRLSVENCTIRYEYASTLDQQYCDYFFTCDLRLAHTSNSSAEALLARVYRPETYRVEIEFVRELFEEPSETEAERTAAHITLILRTYVNVARLRNLTVRAEGKRVIATYTDHTPPHMEAPLLALKDAEAISDYLDEIKGGRLWRHLLVTTQDGWSHAVTSTNNNALDTQKHI